jgi:integrase
VTAAMADLEAGTWTLPEHKTRRKTQKPRVVYLTPVLLELTRTLAQRHPTGPLFRNRDGRPWNRNAIRCRFRRIREKLGLGGGVVAYLYRHGFATDALERGVPSATVAELLGHEGTRMLATHYSHLAEKREHLRRAALRATQPEGPSGA